MKHILYLVLGTTAAYAQNVGVYVNQTVVVNITAGGVVSINSNASGAAGAPTITITRTIATNPTYTAGNGSSSTQGIMTVVAPIVPQGTGQVAVGGAASTGLVSLELAGLVGLAVGFVMFL
jgi:hypothetical protein